MQVAVTDYGRLSAVEEVLLLLSFESQLSLDIKRRLGVFSSRLDY
jgi:hypothetical protein